MSQKTRVLNVRVVGFSAPERQMLNSIFLLSVAPARQIGYKLWNSESGTAPDMYLLDGDSESAVVTWQAAFSNAFERTLVVGSKNTDLGCTSAARPLGLKVVGAMDRLAIALNNMALNNAREPAGFDVSEPRAGTMPTGAGDSSPSMSAKPDASLPPRVATGMTAQQPVLSASMSSSLAGGPISAGAATLASMTAGATAPLPGGTLTPTGTLPTSMTASAPAATVLPNVTLQPNLSPTFEKTFSERPLTEKSIDKMLSDKPAVEKPAAPALPPISGATPLSPSALAAAVAPSPRANLRVVPPPSSMAGSLPSAAATASFAARIAEAPMNPAVVPPAPAPAPAPVTPTVTVPVLTPAAAPIAFVPPPPAPIMPAPVMPTAVPTPRHEEQVFRVLTVDDSPLMRTFLQNKLAPYGINPEFAASGEEALYKISKQHFDLIFLDVMLPGMDGYDVCKMIKKNKDNNLMKVVMLTSKDKTFDKIRGTMAGCDGYLTKPVDEMKLRAIIERHTVTRK